MKTLLSIIIPTYNCEEFVHEGIEAVLRQLPEDYELIIVDDGSTDGTVQRLADYEGRQTNVRVFYGEHKGASAARNAGLDMAIGDFVGFMDCDDCIREDFFKDSSPLLVEDADLYIFGIERIHLHGNSEFWTVRDHRYDTASDFADEYIRTRQLLVYSNCNMFYRRSILNEKNLRFREDIAFGEDRLFNYYYLSHCGSIVTSSLIALRYIQRSDQSMSSKYVPNYFDQVMMLHDEKMKCFLRLSKGTDHEERMDFIAYDLSTEIERTLERFAEHPEEREENLPRINEIVFGGKFDPDVPIDTLIILGSTNCEYKAAQALPYYYKNPALRFVVSGGNIHLNGMQTEAEFMADYLQKHGVPESQIYLENRAKYTKQNLEFSNGVICEIKAEKIGIMTGGFHIPRTKLLAMQMNAFEGKEIYWLPAFGPNTHIDDWFENPTGLSVILQEIRKTIKLDEYFLTKYMEEGTK